LLGKVTRHELGHVFGLSHQQNDSIMVTGQILAKITDKDCKNVVAKYGKGWS
ncbi:MAG: matrixin family metalloprotease, partial [Thaumarchaeota archaeon]